jgi:hypothetical protein
VNGGPARPALKGRAKPRRSRRPPQGFRENDRPLSALYPGRLAWAEIGRPFGAERNVSRAGLKPRPNLQPLRFGLVGLRSKTSLKTGDHAPPIGPRCRHAKRQPASLVDLKLTSGSASTERRCSAMRCAQSRRFRVWQRPGWESNPEEPQRGAQRVCSPRAVPTASTGPITS